MHAAPLVGAGDRVAVTLQPAGRSEIGLLLLGAYGLTPRETEVALAAIRNQTNPQIAAELQLSAWTVQDHLKSVFGTTGVHSRRELSTRFFRPPIAAGRRLPGGAVSTALTNRNHTGTVVWSQVRKRNTAADIHRFQGVRDMVMRASGGGGGRFAHIGHRRRFGRFGPGRGRAIGCGRRIR